VKEGGRRIGDEGLPVYKRIMIKEEKNMGSGIKTG
jgi:hypothetical protein